MKVSIWFFMVLLMTMSVASVAKGEANLILDIDIYPMEVFVGDTIRGFWSITNDGSSVATNLEADVVCPKTKPERIHYVIGGLNPNHAFVSDINVKAVKPGTGQCILTVDGPGNHASIGTEAYNILEQSVPEFSTGIAIPIVGILGVVLLLSRRRV
jgi:hypothetical protein